LNEKINRLLKTLGSRVLFASAAIGVSHLVQSARAGADFGFVTFLLLQEFNQKLITFSLKWHSVSFLNAQIMKIKICNLPRS